MPSSAIYKGPELGLHIFLYFFDCYIFWHVFDTLLLIESYPWRLSMRTWEILQHGLSMNVTVGGKTNSIKTQKCPKISMAIFNKIILSTKWYRIIKSLRNLRESKPSFWVCNVPADGISPLGPRPYRDKLRTKFGPAYIQDHHLMV